MKRTECPSSL
jgi:hypothetical protein